MIDETKKSVLYASKFSGQYRSLAPEPNKLNHNCRSLSMKQEGAIKGINHDHYKVERGNPKTHTALPWSSKLN